MGDVSATNATNVALYDESGNEIGSLLGKDSSLNNILSELKLRKDNLILYSSTPVGASGAQSTGWIDTNDYPDFYFFWYSYVEPVSAIQEWSDDGVTPLQESGNAPSAFSSVQLPINSDGASWNVNIRPVRPKIARYMRITITNGASTQIGSSPIPGTLPDVEMFLWSLESPYQGAFTSAQEQISNLTSFLLTRSLITGDEVDGLLNKTGEIRNVEVTSTGSLKAAIPWENLLKYATPTDPELPSGPPVTIHQVLNTESNVIDTGWVPAREFPGGQFLHVKNAMGNLKVYIANASDDQGNNAEGLDFPNGVTQPGEPLNISAAFFDDYFRAIIVNDSGQPSGDITVRSMGLQAPPPPVVFSLSQNIPDFVPAAVVQVVIKARNSATSTFNVVEASPSGSLHVAQTDRPSELRNRLKVEKHVSAVSSDTIIHTVTPGYTFYLQSIGISAVNSSITTNGEYGLTDDGIVKMPYIVPGRILGGQAQGAGDPTTFAEPVSFSTNVKFEILNTAEITASVYIIGYEEPN